VLIDVNIDTAPAGQIRWELRPDAAPKTAARIKALIEMGFYNGLIFHRVVPNFVIQGGDPTGTGSGGSGQSIVWEDSPLNNVRGSVAMARAAGNPDSADSQFFINLKDNPNLDGSSSEKKYVVFALVTAGMDVVDKIALVQTNTAGKPAKNVTMVSVKIAP
jgi:cyclophilin family peptidyl-prolyl cis-trans isomerase